MSENTAKEIGRLAGRTFQAIIPKNWAVRSQEDQEDYGVDYEIELTTSGDKPTGFIFKVQQKGVEKLSRLNDGRISFSRLETEKVTYYLRQLRIPIVFVVVDIETRKSYWIPLHGNREVEADLADALASGHNTMTLHLPPENVLPETVGALLEAVKRMMDALTLAGIKAMPTADAQALIDSEPDLDELERGVRFTQSFLRSTRTQRLIEKGDYQDAFTLNKKAFIDDAEPAEVRFASGMQLVRIAGGMAVQQGDREEEIKLRLQVTQELVRICRRLPSTHQLRYYSVFLARTSRLRVHVYRDWGLFFSRFAQEAAPDEFARYVTAGAQRKSVLSVTTELHRAQRLLLQLVQYGWIGLAVYAWAELTEAVISFLTRLEKDNITAGAASIREWLHSIGTVCRELVVQLKDDSLIGLCAVNHARIDIDVDSFSQRLIEARGLAGEAGIDEKKIAESQLDQLEKLAAQKSEDPPEEHDQAALEQVVRQMSHGLGINIDDPNDSYARIVRIGLRDANPERVLRDCKQLVVQLGSSGIPAQMLGLPTAGSKYIACRKHGYRSSGFSLDDLYAFFKASHCDSCPDRAEHPQDWKWTRAWQIAQEQGYEQDRVLLMERQRQEDLRDIAESAKASSSPRRSTKPNAKPKPQRRTNGKSKRKNKRNDRKRNKRK
jgi:hypothetical protein